MICEGQMIDGWEEYEFTASLIEPAQSFSLRRPFQPAAWAAFRRDAQVTILVDGTAMITGYVDERDKRSKDHSMEITGRCKGGRVVQESAPSINYEGLAMDEAILRLVSPHYPKVTLSDARNRRLRMGKGYKIPGLNGDLVVQSHVKGGSSGANPFGRQPNPFRLTPVNTGGKVHPGETRQAVIEEILSQSGLISWGSADGKEYFVGYPDQEQVPSFIVRLAKPGSGNATTVKELDYKESNGDRFSLYACVGSGGGTDQDFGEEVASRRGVVYDDPSNTTDGTGRDFLHPKRMLMPEQNYASNDEAIRVAKREQLRRDFRRTTAVATMPLHGQFIGGGAPTLFAPNTVAAVTDEEMDPVLDDDFMIYECQYKCSRKDGETTVLMMVPTGTEFVH